MCMDAWLCVCVFTDSPCYLKWATESFHLNLLSPRNTSLVWPTCSPISNIPPLHVRTLVSKHACIETLTHTESVFDMREVTDSRASALESRTEWLSSREADVHT